VLMLEALQTADPVSTTSELLVNGTFAGNFAQPAPVKKERRNNFIGQTQYEICKPFKGAIGEIIFYSRYLDTTEREAVESYLKKKWKCCE